MKKAYFISDLHLGASYWGSPRAIEQQAVNLLNHIKEDAEEVFLLGDILDYWFEYKEVVPRGYVRFFGKLAEMSDSGIKITWLIGNHDIWIFDYISEEMGIEVVDGILERDIMGVPFCIQHGDGIGGSAKFRFMRKLFRNKVCQKLYSGIHPRWTVGFAKYCSRRSRLGYKADAQPQGTLINDFEKWCRLQIGEGNPAKYFVFGHLHRHHEISLPNNRRLFVIPDFATEGCYGVFDGVTLRIQSGNVE